LQRASRVLELQGSRVPGLQDSKVAGFHGSKLTKPQESKVAGFHGFKALRVRGSRVPEQKPFAGALAGMPRKNSWNHGTLKNLEG